MANYNAARFLGQAVKSIIRQTYENWELIFVDDMSTDNSVNIINKYKDPRIKIILRGENGGYGKTLQTAIANASGSICGIFDSDDVLDKNSLQIMVEAHKKNPDHGLIYSQYMLCDENMKHRSVGDCAALPKNRTWLEVITKDPKPRPRVSHFKVFKRSAYDKTDGFHDLRRTVDKDIVLKLEEVTKLLYVNKVLYYYRAHPAGISRNTKTKTYGDLIIKRAQKRRSK